jgi:AraC-like DNA-binding protein
MVRHFRIPSRLPLKLEELGVPVSPVLRHAGLRHDFFQQPRLLLNTEELFALWRAIGQISKDPGIGVKLGTAAKTERFLPSGIVALSTKDFGAAIDHFARYKQLTCPEELLQHSDEEEWRIGIRWILAVENEPPALTECSFAWLLSIGRHGSGTPITPLRLELVQPRTHLRLLERHFGCPITTGAAQNAIVFRASDKSRPFITRNDELLDMLAPRFNEELKQCKESSLTELVRGAIQHRLTGHRPAVEDVARDLHMSSRTLQRRLQEEGSSYQRVLDEARHQMARYYLSNSVFELNEAAYLLGYEDANSFVRAFRNWEGVPPSLWRQTQHSSSVN